MSQKIAEEMRRKEQAKLSSHGQEPREAVTDGDAAMENLEEPDGSGRNSNHAVLGVQLLDGRKLLAWVPYASVLWGESPDITRRLTFETVRGEVLHRVTLEGEASMFGAVVNKLLEGKRVSVKINGESVTKITVEAVKAK